ncbi:MAG: DUF2887 domain-containing protein [Microcystis panniformis]
MKTDKIFYTLFQVFPELLFELLGESPKLAQNYQFKSVEIKEWLFSTLCDNFCLYNREIFT